MHLVLNFQAFWRSSFFYVYIKIKQKSYLVYLQNRYTKSFSGLGITGIRYIIYYLLPISMNIVKE